MFEKTIKTIDLGSIVKVFGVCCLFTSIFAVIFPSTFGLMLSESVSLVLVGYAMED